MNNGRKYLLDLALIRSEGIASRCSVINETNLLNCFNISYDTTEGRVCCSYPTITLGELSALSKLDYEKRVLHFIDKNIDEEETKIDLFNSATFNEPCSEYYCKLNEDFLVYKFLTGIRIIDVGTSNGVIEYKVYPINNNPDNYNWSLSPTFLNLNQDSTYVAVIRDNINGEIVCEYQKNISLQLLNPSTTEAPTEKIVSINNLNSFTCGSYSQFSSIISVNPQIADYQKIDLCYSINLIGVNDGYSCITLKCKSNTDSYVIFDTIDVKNSVVNEENLITLNKGDSVCYDIGIIRGLYGSESSVSFNLINVDGLNTTPTSIDLTKCSEYRVCYIPPQPITISFGTPVNGSPANGVDYNYGLLLLSNPIPINECISINFSGDSESILGSSCYAIYCKQNNTTNFIKIYENCNTFIQPQISPQVTIKTGDILCYSSTVVSVYDGSSSISTYRINDVSSSVGVNPTIGVNNQISISNSKPSLNVSVNVCKLSDTINGPARVSQGFINLSPVLNSDIQCVNVDYYATLNHVGNAGATINLGCRANGQSSFIDIPNSLLQSHSGMGQFNNSFIMKRGDCVCYCLVAVDVSGGASSSITLDTVNGMCGVVATINNLKQSDSISN
jgi:hypothetical protein